MVTLLLAAADDVEPQAEWTSPASEHVETPPASDPGPVADLPTDAAPAVVVEPQAQAAADAHTAERHFRKAMRTASDAVAESALRWSSLRTQAANAKKDFDFKVEELQRIANRGPEHLPLFDTPSPVGGAACEPPSHEPGGPPNTTNKAGHAPAGDGPDLLLGALWRNVTIGQLGLPPKLQERLECAGISTIGAFEDMRAADTWPKGIGPTKKTICEDAVIAWLSKHRDAAVLAQETAAPAAVIERAIDESDLGPAPPTDSDEAIMAAGGDPDIHDAVEGSEAGVVDLTDPEAKQTKEEWDERIKARARWIESLIARKPEAIKPDHPETFESGRAAFHRGDPIEDSPNTGDRLDDWLKGWLAGKFNLHVSNGEAKKPRSKRAKKASETQ